MTPVTAWASSHFACAYDKLKARFTIRRRGDSLARVGARGCVVLVPDLNCRRCWLFDNCACAGAAQFLLSAGASAAGCRVRAAASSTFSDCTTPENDVEPPNDVGFPQSSTCARRSAAGGISRSRNRR